MRTAGIGERLRQSQSLGKGLVVQVQAAEEVPHENPGLMAETDKKDDDDQEVCLSKSRQ